MENTEKMQKDHKLVGATVPLQVSSYLSLYARSPGITKASLIRNIIHDWIKEQKVDEGITEFALIDEWQRKIQLFWEGKKLHIEDRTMICDLFSDFKEYWMSSLQRHGICEEHADEIIKGIKQ